MVKVSVVTPTCDRPHAFALCERWMARQTVTPDEWIVADGGKSSANCTMRQRHLHDPSQPGAANFARNLTNGLLAASGDVVVFVEDDDHYAPDHVEHIVSQLERNPQALAAGDDRLRYYNVAHRWWREFANVGSALCQTALRREAIPGFLNVIRECRRVRAYGIDAAFWRLIPRERWAISRTGTVVGMKGLPGTAGLGIGHRPRAEQWNRDRDGAKLREWIGYDADLYCAAATTTGARTVAV